MAKQKREFIDKHRKILDEYYDFIDRINSLSKSKLKKEAKKLIEKDPDFFDSYAILCELLHKEGKVKESEELLENAYRRAIKLITSNGKNWPDSLRWGWIENRHIIRIILNKAIESWSRKKNDEALDILRKLLKSNPEDNIGSRHFILAINMNIDYIDFEKRFNKNGYYDDDLNNWFERNYHKFPEEFKCYDEYSD